MDNIQNNEAREWITEEPTAFPTIAHTSAHQLAPDEVGQKAAGLVNIRDIIAVRAMPKKELYVPAWGGFIVIQALTRKQAEKVREDSMVTDEAGNRAPDKELSERVMVKASIVQPRLTTEQVEQLFQVSELILIEWIIKEINELNGKVGADLEEAKKKAEYSFRA